MIEVTVNKYNLKKMTTFLCQQAKVFRSGF